MPVDVAKLRAEFLAQSDLNSDAIAAYRAKYPLLEEGDLYTDENGFDWRVEFIYGLRNSVVVVSRFIDSGVDTEKYSIHGNTDMSRMWVTYPFDDVLTAAAPGWTITINEAQYGEILDVQIESASIAPSSYAWDADHAELTVDIAVSDSAALHVLYKKRPYFYGYQMGGI